MPEISLRLVSLPSNQESSSSTFTCGCSPACPDSPALERDLRAALARVELAQERHRERLEAEEAVGSEVTDFCCPVGLQLMREPVMLEDGRSYEKAEIDKWFQQQAREGKPFSSPMTRAPVSTKLVVNLNLKNAIDAAVEAKQAELRKLMNAIDTAVKVMQAELRKRKRDD